MKYAVAVLSVVVASAVVRAAEPAAQALVVVDHDTVVRPIRPMNAICNGPSVKKPGGDQKRGNFEEYAAARIPFARTHDSINCVSGGAHTCDISAVFPNFEADETDPKNYDFVFTDHYLDNIRRAGTEIFFRLGQTIEHGPKKYGIFAPKNYGKWARICEHIIRHYNEGWGWGLDNAPTTRNIAYSNQFNIVYWEIWNEADLDAYDDEKNPNRNPRNWVGTVTNFFELYETTAKHLKGKFPHLKIGGPSQAGNNPWMFRFLSYCRDRKVPLDFYSWHCYARNPVHIAERSAYIRERLDEYGFVKTESILNEWNYVKGWVDDWVYSMRVISGDMNLKGAAFIASAMVQCQNEPVDMLMFYNSRGSMNALFDGTTMWPKKGYYPFYLWSKLSDLGSQVALDVTQSVGADSDANTGNVEKKDKAASGQFAAVAAKGANGKGAVFIARYSDDDNSTDIAKVTIRVAGKSLAGACCLLTDMARTCTEVPVVANADGSAIIRMHPNSFALIEY